MKHFTVIMFLTLFYVQGFSQDLSGTWQGVFISNTYNNIQREFTFYLQIQQQGNAVWAVYTTGTSKKIDSADCMCNIEGELYKEKKDTFIKVYKDKVLSYNNNIRYASCDFINYFELYYEKQADAEYLKGKWFGSIKNRFTADGSGGSVILQKVSPQLLFSIDQYFPKLNKLIERYNKTNISY